MGGAVSGCKTTRGVWMQQTERVPVCIPWVHRQAAQASDGAAAVARCRLKAAREKDTPSV